MNVKQSFRAVLPTGLLIGLFLILAAGIAAGSSFAQSTGGRIRGTVTDPSGGAVVGARVEGLKMIYWQQTDGREETCKESVSRERGGLDSENDHGVRSAEQRNRGIREAHAEIGGGA